jgi:2-oxoisovalerate dehydrogenase E2 component (dihydrolipoyl transacylase)
LAVTVELPHVGESVVEGTIGKWLKQPGDSVRRYEPLVEIVTDKVTMEIPSPVEGQLLRVLAAEGETLPMGAPIAEVGAPGEAPSTDAPPPPPPAATPAAPASAAPVGTTGYLMRDVTPVGPTGGAAVEAMEPTASIPAPSAPAAAPAPVASVAPAPTAPISRDAAPRLSPAVRRLAREHSVDLSLIRGTGMGGRITRDDVLRYLAEPQTVPAPAAPAQSPAPAVLPAAAPAASVAAGPDEELMPITPVRRMIAEAMVRSVTEIPHAWSVKEVDVTGLVALRQSVRAEFERQEGVALTYMPFVIRAVVEALRKVPTMNATWGGDSIILKRRINLGLAVAAPNGLIVPVIHNADRLTIPGLAHAVQDVTERARTNRLTIEDVQGGTFTLNNTGALGGSLVSGPIINYPQAGIMTTETIEKRPVVRDDAIAIRSMMNICLAFDHRINDGAEASGFLDAVKARLESYGPGTPVY